MVVKYLAGERLIGTAAERAALTTVVLTDPIKSVVDGSSGGFVMDLSWYRGSSDTSHESNEDSNRVFISSNTAGYVISGVTSTDRQVGFMLSSGNTHGIINKGSTGEYWASDSGTIQDTGAWWYYRLIFDDSENTFQWFRFANVLHRNAMTVSSHDSSGIGVSASVDVGTNFDAGRDLTYLTVTAKDSANGNTDYKIDDIKFWKNTEDAVTGSPTPDIHITFSDTSGWTNLSAIGSVTNGEVVLTGHSTTPASYAIPNSYPNLPNGAIFEESDTGKHYMFDGTSTWNEMT